MNYENEALSKIDENLKQSKELLDSLKEQFSEQNLNLKIENELNKSKEALQTSLKEKLKSFETLFLNSLNENVKSELLKLYESKKEDLKGFVKEEIDLNELSKSIASSFLNENLNNLKESLNEALQNDELFLLLNEKKKELNIEAQNALSQLDKALENELLALDKKIEDRFLLYLNSLKEQSKELLKEYINEHKTELFKPFKLDFLKDALLKDEDFKKTYKEVALQSVVTFINTDTFKDEIENTLLNMNAKISDEFFNSIYLHKQKFVANASLASISLSNALKELSKELSKLSLNDDKKENDETYKKIFKVV